MSQAPGLSELFCPRCRKSAPLGQWFIVFRRLEGETDTLPLIRVLRHRLCRGLVYFLVQ
jgi:hypothetical protein